MIISTYPAPAFIELVSTADGLFGRTASGDVYRYSEVQGTRGWVVLPVIIPEWLQATGISLTGDE